MLTKCCALPFMEHKIVDNWFRLIAFFAIALVAASCAETELAVHTAKQLERAEAETSQGVYKVGQPYQIAGAWYYPQEDYQYAETGIASWYGPGFDGNHTANGEIYDQDRLTAAHRTLPMPSMVRVTNLENGRSIKVRVNDRGPFAKNRIIDVSRKAARLLGFERKGTAKVRVEVLAAESRHMAAVAQRGEVAGNAPSAVPVENVATQELGPLGSATDAPPPAPRESTQTASRTIGADRRDESVIQMPVKRSEIFVQVGAFSQVHNALRLKARLSGLSPVKIVQTSNRGTQLFKVRLGPLPSVEAADRLVARLEASGLPDTSVVVE